MTARPSGWAFFQGAVAMAKSEKIEITDDMRAELHRLKQQSGISTYGLFKNTRFERPQGLNSRIVNGWLEDTRWAKKDHYDYVVELWREKDPYQPLTPEMIDFLVQYKTQIRVHFKYARNAPKGLSWYLINGYWIYRRAKRVKTEHWQYVSQIPGSR